MSSNTSALAWARVRYVLVAVRSVFSKEKKLAIAALYCTSQPHRVSFVHKQKGIPRI